MSKDTIYRQDAVSRFSDLLMVELKGKRLPTWDEVYNAMQDVPAAEPEPPEYCIDCPTFRKTQLLIPPRKKGKWLDDCGGVKCSVCGYHIDDPYYVEGYCTKCGSYNKED